MPYRNNARFVSKEIESDGNYVEMYEYRNNNYWIYPDSETPVDLQHQFEQQFIDYYIEKNKEEQLQQYLEDKFEEDFC